MMRNKRQLEHDLRDHRPSPPDRLLEAATSRIERSARPSPRRYRLGLAAAVAVAAVVLTASLGGLSYAATVAQSAGAKVVEVVETKPAPRNTGAAKSAYLASIGTYKAGQWICHWKGKSYTKRGSKLSRNWRAVQLTSQSVYAVHVKHKKDYGPRGNTTSARACAKSAPAPRRRR
jgi:hypothetical protein